MTVEMPLIVLSAIGDEDAKVRALAAGTDDYVAKPFGPRELIPPAPGQPAPDRPGARAVVDPDRGAERRPGLPHGRARRRGGPSDPDRVRLPQAAGPQSRAADNTPGPADGCLGVGYGNDTQVLRAHIANLRRKIEPDGGAGGHRYIRTDPGVGYRFVGWVGADFPW